MRFTQTKAVVPFALGAKRTVVLHKEEVAFLRVLVDALAPVLARAAPNSDTGGRNGFKAQQSASSSLSASLSSSSSSSREWNY